MAIAVLMDFPEIPGKSATDVYDGILEKMDLKGKPAPGGIFHVAGPYQGGLRIIDVWESEDDLNKFLEKYGHIFAEAGVTPPQPTVWPVHNTISS